MQQSSQAQIESGMLQLYDVLIIRPCSLCWDKSSGDPSDLSFLVPLENQCFNLCISECFPTIYNCLI